MSCHIHGRTATHLRKGEVFLEWRMVHFADFVLDRKSRDAARRSINAPMSSEPILDTSGFNVSVVEHLLASLGVLTYS